MSRKVTGGSSDPIYITGVDPTVEVPVTTTNPIDVQVTDGTDNLAVNPDGSINVVVGGTITQDVDIVAQSVGDLGVSVNNANVDIRDLNAALDSVSIGDGVDSLLINSDGSINTVTTPATETLLADESIINILNTIAELLVIQNNLLMSIASA